MFGHYGGDTRSVTQIHTHFDNYSAVLSERLGEWRFSQGGYYCSCSCRASRRRESVKYIGNIEEMPHSLTMPPKLVKLATIAPQLFECLTLVDISPGPYFTVSAFVSFLPIAPAAPKMSTRFRSLVVELLPSATNTLDDIRVLGVGLCFLI